MEQSAESLLKYDNPVLSVREPPNDQSFLQSTSSGASNNQNREILNAILPPRQLMVGNQLWVQEVSAASSSRTDLIHLEKELDKKLQQSPAARHTGICDVRSELYPQFIDELIRQVTINCAERGLLLRRIKDEYDRTLNTCLTLHESSVAFGTRRELETERKVAEMKETVSALEREIEDLKEKLNDQKARCAKVEEEGKDKTQFEGKICSEEKIEPLRNISQQFRAELADMIEPE